jgi:hypothetical protein
MMGKKGLKPALLTPKNKEFSSAGFKKMNINKVDLVLKYILATAGQEDYGNREVGPIHLIKYVYLADLAVGGRTKGRKRKFWHENSKKGLTPFSGRFRESSFFRPWSEDRF